MLTHDVYDWDLQLPPILAKSGDRDIALAAGKQGYVYAIDRGDGAIVWKVPVGKHNGHDRRQRACARGQLRSDAEAPASRCCPASSEASRPRWPIADGVVYAPIVNVPTVFNTQDEIRPSVGEGDRRDGRAGPSNGSVKWQHDLAQPAYGAATISNDLVFTTTFEGKLIALNKNTGEVAWETQLPAGTNATVAIVGDTLITAASFPQSASQKPVIIAYRLGATGSVTTTATTTATTTGGGTTSGEAVFTANCGSCHTLNAAGTTGSVGPDLDDLKPSAATVESQVRNGGGGMPAFQGRLSDAEIMAVAQYVAQNAGKVSSRGGGGGP